MFSDIDLFPDDAKISSKSNDKSIMFKQYLPMAKSKKTKIKSNKVNLTPQIFVTNNTKLQYLRTQESIYLKIYNVI